MIGCETHGVRPCHFRRLISKQDRTIKNVIKLLHFDKTLFLNTGKDGEERWHPSDEPSEVWDDRRHGVPDIPKRSICFVQPENTLRQPLYIRKFLRLIKPSLTYISKQSTFYLGHINNWLQNGPPSFKVLLKIHQSPNWRFLLLLTLKLVYLNLHVFDLHSRHIQGSFVWQSTRTNDFPSTHRTSYRNTEGKEETRCRPISSPLLIMPTTTCYRVSIMPYWCS